MSNLGDVTMSKKIFLIDDEKDFTELTRALFEFQGFEVETANDPVEGLKQLLAAPADALVVDIMMPGLDGLNLVRQLRANTATADLPVFILSAKKLSDDERKEILTSQTHFVSKPFEPRRLVELVKENIGG